MPWRAPVDDAARVLALASAIDGVVFLVDANGCMSAPQASWEAHTGQSFEEARGLGFHAAAHSADRARLTRAWDEGICSGRAFELSVRVRQVGRSEPAPCSLRVVPVQPGLDRVEEWVCVLRPSATPRAEASPVTSVSLARGDDVTMDALQSLARGIAHQLNNLMHGMMVHAELIARQIGAESRAHDSVRHVLRATQRGAEFGHQLLAFAGRGSADVARVDVGASVAAMRPLLAALCTSGVELELSLREGVRPIYVDEGRLRHVLVALVQNAVEALSARGGRICVRSGFASFTERELLSAQPRAHARAGCYVFVEVEDDGPGISPDAQARIFEPFFANKFTGRGLGLPVVLGIVRTWGGLVSVASEPGRGTCVRILFPAHDA